MQVILNLKLPEHNQCTDFLEFLSGYFGNFTLLHVWDDKRFLVIRNVYKGAILQKLIHVLHGYFYERLPETLVGFQSSFISLCNGY